MKISKCKYCKEPIPANKSFCNRSCSAKFNNKPQGICKMCKCPIPKANKYCGSCRSKGFRNSINKRSDWIYSTTVRDILSKNKGQPSNNYRQIRDHARQLYINSNNPQKCAICGYSLHFDVCHIVSIKDFHLDTTIDKVNSIDNLVALCKNHHWEFDNNYITENQLFVPTIGFEPMASCL